MKRRKDRYTSIEQHLRSIGTTSFERFNAVNGLTLKDPRIKRMEGVWDHKKWYRRLLNYRMNMKNKRGRFGCYLSHFNLLQKICSESPSSALILEDDCRFIVTSKTLEAFHQGMKELPKNWDFLMLGASHKEPPTKANTCLVYPQRSLATHAYAIHHTIYPHLSNLLTASIKNPSLEPIDRLIAQCQKKSIFFALNPLIAYQAISWSDIEIKVSNQRFNQHIGIKMDFP